jgi:tetratricopeptide (TPR) repeat protein
MAGALEAAGPLLRIAQASGVPMIEITGRHATAYSLVYRGEVEPALEEAEAGLALYEFEQEKVLANTFSLSSSVCLRASRGHALWMLGRVVEAEDEWDTMLQLARDLQHPPSYAAALAFTLHGGGFRYGYIGEMDRLAGIADELLVRSREVDFFLWYAVAYTYRGVVAEAIGNGEQARRQMLEGLDLFAQTGSRLTLVMMNILCAEAFYRLGDDGEAFRRLEVAEAEMIARQEGLLGPDIWRVRGRLLARRGERRAAEAAYHHAIERARAQSTNSLGLRAGLDLYELLAEDGRAEKGRAVLAGLLVPFTQGFDRPELARARIIVQASV